MSNSKCMNNNDNKDLIIRLNRIEGQIKAIKNLLNSEEKCECMILLNQLKSATCAMRGAWETVAAKHLEECVVGMDNKSERNKIIEEIITCLKELR